MKQKRFSGVVVPMVTPLTPQLSIDGRAVKCIMANFAAHQLSPLVLGTTGESSSVGEQESLRLVEMTVAAKQDGQLVYAGLVGNEMQSLLERANRYADLGADAVVATLPCYYSLNRRQMRDFYLRLADASKVPVFMYNIKATTQMSIPLDLAEELSHHPNIAGLKDSERDEDKLKQSVEAFHSRDDFSFFCGWGAQGAHSLQLGADGIVPSTGNVVPELYGWLYQAFLDGDLTATNHFQTLTDQVATVYQKGRSLGESLAALKVLMHHRGWCGPSMMPPLDELPEEEACCLVEQYQALPL